ncbi:radical SAM protein [uncultured Clostridium sp.]|uniref:radical SAM protein n=1 Tax=uncultured Clostridium sp. TaxID=59620 RepID=UPI00261A1B4D|nr:radical SAM protein [uncultured Clostridium sp.]
MVNLARCNICPHECNCNRKEGKIGRCKATDKVRIALYSTHDFEEPCVSGKRGSGTVFFSNCNLNCMYCQNYEISQQGKGKDITIEELANIFLIQQEKGVENINLVTPTSYALSIIDAIQIAKQKGLTIPILYNTNAYEKVETLKLLEGYIDIYLPDLKYADDSLGLQYSKVNDYFEVATKAIHEMIRQVGTPKLNQEGVIQKGVMVRHLVLPNHMENSKKVLKWIKEKLPNEIYISIMAQYFPTYQAKNVENLSRKLTPEEWQEIEDYIEDLAIENGYVQELEEHEEEYVPKWMLDDKTFL